MSDSADEEWCAPAGTRRQEDLDDLMPRVYDELRRLAKRALRRERRGHTLQPTALVNEVYVRLASSGTPSWRDRSHFYRLAALAMRRILVNHARDRGRLKRGGRRGRVPLEGAIPVAAEEAPDFEALDAALDQLSTQHARACQVVELRFFGGLSVDLTAEVLAVSPATVKREWSFAKAWLYGRLSGDGPESA